MACALQHTTVDGANGAYKCLLLKIGGTILEHVMAYVSIGKELGVGGMVVRVKKPRVG
jgi:hypothetical protein